MSHKIIIIVLATLTIENGRPLQDSIQLNVHVVYSLTSLFYNSIVKTIYNPVTTLLPSIGCALENGISGIIGVNMIIESINHST